MAADQSATFNDATATAKEVNSFAACKWRFLRAIELDRRLNDRDRRVGTYIVERYIHKSGNVAYPGMQRLANELGKSTRTIERALWMLVRCGYLIQGRSGGGRGHANEYTVDWSQYDKPQTPTDLSKKPRQICHPKRVSLKES